MLKRSFRRFIVAISVIFALTIAADITAGYVLNYMMGNLSVTGDLCLTNLGVNIIKTPIVVVGSSRASHHYDTSILKDSLHKEVYNVGVDGCFLTHNCCIINSLFERYTPELIIWEFNPSYLFDYSDPITTMYPYYDKRDYITAVINEDVDWKEKVRLKSNFYRFNSTVQRIVLKYFQNIKEDVNRGYEPTPPKKLLAPLALKEVLHDSVSINEKRLERFKNIIKLVKNNGSKIVLFDSPRYEKVLDNDRTQQFKRICADLDVPFIDMSQTESFLSHPDYFSDATHLSEIGAKVYTEMIIKELR